MGLIEGPLCRKCGAEDETSTHILCQCEALALLRHVYLGCFFLEPENIKNVSLGAKWNIGKVTNKGKAIPLQALTGPEGSRRLRLPDFKTIGT
jgi:hypothetical protein